MAQTRPDNSLQTSALPVAIRRPAWPVGWRLDGLVLLLFVALTVFMTWPITPNMGRSLEQWGDALLQTWTLDWDAYALLTDPLHLANSNAFYPYADSLAFSETLIGQAILVAPIIWLTGNPVLGYNLLLLSSFVLCGWGMYLLGKDLTGSRVAGLVAGMIFAFFPHRFGQLSHLHLLTAQWMPFALLFLRRFLGKGSGVGGQGSGVGDRGSGIGGREAVESGRGSVVEDQSTIYPQGNPLSRNLQSTIPDPQQLSTINQQLATDSRAPSPEPRPPLTGFLFGLFLVLELLSSTYLGLFLVATVGLYLLYRLVGWLGRLRRGEARWGWRGNRAVGLAVILVAAGLVVTPFYWPYFSVQQDLGFERSASEVQSFSAQPFYYLDVPKENKLNGVLYGPLLKQGWWESSAGGERGLWLGLGALGLGALGAVAAWRGRKREGDGLFYVLLALLAVSFTFGPAWQTGRFGAIPLPYALLYNYVPGFGAIRVPVRFIYVVALAVAALAAFGTAWLQSCFRLTAPRQAGLLAVGLLVLLGGEYWSDVAQQASDTLRRPPPQSAQWLDAHPAPSLHLPLSGSDNSNLFLQYWTRGSWRPIMNGFSGFMPPAYDALKSDLAREGFSPRIVELLQGLEVRYLEIETDDSTIKPQWARLKDQLDKAGMSVAAQFGGTLIYELKPDPWLRKLADLGLQPTSPTYFVEYRRTAAPLLELTASYLERTGTLKREDLYGSISVGFRPLPSLPTGRAADFLVLPAGEDPTLYGFRPADRLLGNDLLTVFKRSGDLLARYDFTRQDNVGAINRTTPLAILPTGDGLNFAGSGAANGSAGRSLSLGLAVLEAQKLTLQTAGGPTQILDLKPGLSTYAVPFGNGLTISGGKFSLAWVELWQNQAVPAAEPNLRSNVVVLSSQARFEDGKAVADVQIVGPNAASQYAATLDIYNTPWGAHPSGHYGYWSLPLPGGQVAQTQWRLDLTHKTMTTQINGNDAPNYPPNPADFDITKYGNLGDFRANLNLYAGDKLVGSAKLYDFTVWTQGDKNRLENRHAGAFKGYNTAMDLLVLP